MSNIETQLQQFKENYWNPTALDWFEYCRKSNKFKDNTSKVGIWPNESEEIISQLSKLNNSWELWQKCVSLNCVESFNQKYTQMCQSQQHWQESFLKLNELLNQPSHTSIAAAQDWLQEHSTDLPNDAAEQLFKIILLNIRLENDMDDKTGLSKSNEVVTNA